jgi:hypothetical protein
MCPSEVACLPADSELALSKNLIKHIGLVQSEHRHLVNVYLLLAIV